MNRRRFLLGSAAILAAPSIVRAQSLMPASTAGLDILGASYSLEDRAFLEGVSQAINDLIVYGNAEIKTPMGIVRASIEAVPLEGAVAIRRALEVVPRIASIADRPAFPARPAPRPVA